ncbi:hypothetical protein, partial [Sutterella wadsworthensis]|uniref:hypothetical protein n=1 Tax=Sutterella wadsworthensis TaxID=40545 RepID=UPI003AB9877B
HTLDSVLRGSASTTTSADFPVNIPLPCGIGSPRGHRQGSPRVSHMRFAPYLSDLHIAFPCRYGVN